MSSFVYTDETKVSILPYFTVFYTVHLEWCIAGSSELFGVLVVDIERNSLTTEPVADIIGIAVVQDYSYTRIDYIAKVSDEFTIDKITSLLECEIDLQS